MTTKEFIWSFVLTLWVLVGIFSVHYYAFKDESLISSKLEEFATFILPHLTLINFILAMLVITPVFYIYCKIKFD